MIKFLGRVTAGCLIIALSFFALIGCGVFLISF